MKTQQSQSGILIIEKLMAGLSKSRLYSHFLVLPGTNGCNHCILFRLEIGIDTQQNSVIFTTDIFAVYIR